MAKYTGKIISFGQGELGQLGTGVTHSCDNPVPVQGMWSSPERHIGSSRVPHSVGVVVKRVFAGGDHTFATILLPEDDVSQ